MRLRQGDNGMARPKHKSKQARKIYKVTAAGKQEVAKWLAGEGRE